MPTIRRAAAERQSASSLLVVTIPYSPRNIIQMIEMFGCEWPANLATVSHRHCGVHRTTPDIVLMDITMHAGWKGTSARRAHRPVSTRGALVMGQLVGYQ